ncbi:hypothetical protein [Chryseobacterium arthrosphaerae]|uniref:hypothetical protein n=1 Tax=Chryseobacterium arthrosphaerae TaxID=651561 RepID=UPI00241C2B2B|nr:hypothetical protein [Chryseobacterium arthrosphaerae]
MVSTIIIITLGIFVIILLFRQNWNINPDYKKMYERKSNMYDELNKMYDESIKLNLKLSRKILELTKEKEESPEE